MNLSKQEETAKLFVIAMYYWFVGDKLNAENAIGVALMVANTSVYGDAE